MQVSEAIISAWVRHVKNLQRSLSHFFFVHNTHAQPSRPEANVPGSVLSLPTELLCSRAGLAATPLVDGLSQLSIRLSFPAGIAERPDAWRRAPDLPRARPVHERPVLRVLLQLHPQGRDPRRRAFQPIRAPAVVARCAGEARETLLGLGLLAVCLPSCPAMPQATRWAPPGPDCAAARAFSKKSTTIRSGSSSFWAACMGAASRRASCSWEPCTASSSSSCPTLDASVTQIEPKNSSKTQNLIGEAWSEMILFDPFHESTYVLWGKCRWLGKDVVLRAGALKLEDNPRWN